MSLIGFYCRKGSMQPKERFYYTLNYDNGHRAVPGQFEVTGDLANLASSLSIERGRDIFIRKCWKEGNDVHYKTLAIHRDGRKIR